MSELSGRCLYCGKSFGTNVHTSVDHSPSKALLRAPYPTNLPTVPSCVKCNSSFSGDKQYMQVLLACVLAGSTDPADQSDQRVRAALSRSPGLRAQMGAAMRKPSASSDRLEWSTETARLANVLTKNARGHLWYECATYRSDLPTVTYAALETLDADLRQAFENGPGRVSLPEVGTRALARVFSADTVEGWTVVQQGRHRFAIDCFGARQVRVRSIISEYLASEVIWPGEPETYVC